VLRRASTVGQECSTLDAKTTYVRGWALLHPFSDDLVAQPRHIVAHELGHILLNTHDEDNAEKKVLELLKSAPSVVAATRRRKPPGA
jgi:hypothetical protein